MKISNINLVYFSATNTTNRIIKTIAKQFEMNIKEYNITTKQIQDEIKIWKDELLIVWVPVYSGRVPSIVIDSINKFKSNSSPAIIFCVYWNHNYDDALIELKDIVESNNFKVISAAAFVAKHSIFSEVAKARPDEEDILEIKKFTQKSKEILESFEDINEVPNFKVKWNNNYRETKKIPLSPKTNKNCNQCLACVRACPVWAISKENPRKTDKNLCISCARCITICPEKARSFSWILYKMASKKFVKNNSERKNIDVFFAK